MSKQTDLSPYNPLRVTVAGLSLLFSRAQGVGILFVVLAIATAAFGWVLPQPAASDGSSGPTLSEILRSLTPEKIIIWSAVAVIICLFVLVVSTMLHGIQSYTAARLARGAQSVRLSDAFNAVLERFGSYFVLVVWMNIKIALWSLLFIVPGIVAFYRYSFAGILFFDHDLTGEAALRESKRLTRRGLLTLYSSQLWFNIVTWFYAPNVIGTASLAILYRDFTALDKAKVEKPTPHPLSWLALALPFLLLLGIVMFSVIVAIVVTLAHSH